MSHAGLESPPTKYNFSTLHALGPSVYTIASASMEVGHPV